MLSASLRRISFSVLQIHASHRADFNLTNHPGIALMQSLEIVGLYAHHDLIFALGFHALQR